LVVFSIASPCAFIGFLHCYLLFALFHCVLSTFTLEILLHYVVVHFVSDFSLCILFCRFAYMELPCPSCITQQRLVIILHKWGVFPPLVLFCVCACPLFLPCFFVHQMLVLICMIFVRVLRKGRFALQSRPANSQLGWPLNI
jgi:hypothetical protein